MNTTANPIEKRLRFFRALSLVAGIATMSLLFGGCALFPNMSENETSVDVGVDVLNKYVWRGIEVSDVPVAQPSIGVANSGFGFSVWGNVDLEKDGANTDDTQGQFNEVDYTLSYEHQLTEWLSMTGGLVHYAFPNDGFPTADTTPGKTLKDGDTTELFVGATLTDIPLNPTLTAFVDVDEVQYGCYANLSVSHSLEIPIAEKCPLNTVDLGMGLGWGSTEYNEFYFGNTPSAGGALADFTASVAFPIDLDPDGNSGWIITPKVMYAALLDDDLAANHDGNDGSIIWGVHFAIPF